LSNFKAYKGVLLEAKNKYHLTSFLSATNRVGHHIVQTSFKSPFPTFNSCLKTSFFWKNSDWLINQVSVSEFQVLSSSQHSIGLHLDNMKNRFKEEIKISVFHLFKSITFQVSSSKAFSYSKSY